MTRFWIRNLTSRNDSRTGPVVTSRGGVGGAPGGAGTLGGAAGVPGAAGAAPGRALSIRFSRDIAYPLLTIVVECGRSAACLCTPYYRQASSERFWTGRWAGWLVAAAGTPATARASRMTSWATCVSRLATTKGTPRFKA